MTCVSFMPIRAHQSGHRRSHVARAAATVGAPRRPTTPAGERLARARVTEIELRTSRAAGRKRSGLRCLVDDESDMADLFRQRFRREVRQGTNAMHFANSGEDALGKFAGGRRRADPDRDPVGHQYTGHGRTRPAGRDQTTLPEMPVMMVTAYGDDERRRRAKELGVAEFLTKPVDFALLKVRLRQLPSVAD